MKAGTTIAPAAAAGDKEAEIARLRAELDSLRSEHERLRESEKMYRFSAEIGGRLAWCTDPDGCVLAISRIFKSLVKIGDEEELRQGWINAVHPDDRDEVLGRWAHSLRTGEPFSVEFRGELPDGSFRWALSRAAPSRDREGRIVRWYGSTEDIDDEREAERARSEVEERYRLAARATNDAIWDYDVRNGTIDRSDNDSPALGWGAEMRRTSIDWWRERVHPDDSARVQASLAGAFASGASRWSDQYRFRRADGSYADVLDRGFIVRDDSGEPVRAVGAMTDLTEQNRAEAELRRVQSELIHVSRLSAMGTMASTLAHELNQPLAAASNFLSGARRLAASARPGTDLIAAIEGAAASAQRAGEIVRRLRHLVSGGSPATAVESLPTLIEEAGVLAFVDEEKLGVRHRLDLDPDAAWVRADRIQIQQVLINLARNAIEAMDGSAEREVVIATRGVADDMIEVSVADTGSGIPPEFFDSLFSEFTTTKSSGMGLGLPICRTIVEAHGGTISAENRAQGGALFRFTLPRAGGDPAVRSAR